MKVNNLLNTLFLVFILFGSIHTADGDNTVQGADNAQPDASVQAKPVFDSLFGTVGEIKTSLKNNAETLLSSCSKKQQEIMQEHFDIAHLVGTLRNNKVPEVEGMKADIKKAMEKSELVGMEAKIDEIASQKNVVVKDNTILTIKTAIEASLIEKLKNSFVPLEIYVPVLIKNAIELGSIESLGLDDSEALPADYKFLSVDQDLSSVLGNLETIEEIKAQCTAEHGVNDPWTIKPENIAKEGVAMYLWFKQDSTKIQTPENKVVTLDTTETDPKNLLTVHLNENTVEQTEMVVEYENEKTGSYVSKCLDYTFVLISIEEDCDGLLIRTVVRNVTNNSRDVFEKKVTGVELRGIVAAVHKYSDDNAPKFNKLDNFTYSQEAENNVFASTLTEEMRKMIKNAYEKCKVPENCAYFNGEKCDKCELGKLTQEDKCVDKCDDGFYQDGAACKPCNVTCAKCKGPDADDCLECPIEMNPDGTPKNPEDVTKPITYLEAVTGELPEGPLPVDTTIDAKCVPKCGKGHFEKEIKKAEDSAELARRVCVPCEDKCLVCKDAETCTTCEKSNSDVLNALYDADCVDKCSDKIKNDKGHFYDPVTNSCLPCGQEKCVKCDSDKQCQECAEGTFLEDGQCVEKCKDGNYGENKECKPCLDNCAKCQNGEECDKCKDTYVIHRNGEAADTCDGNCEEGFTEVVEDGAKVCKECERTDCLKCDTDISKCDKCKDKNAEGEDLFLKNETKCVTECGDGLFENAETDKCEKCDESCETCDNADSCTKCKDGLTFMNGKCLQECPKNSAMIESTEESPKEHKKECIPCEDSENCLDCSIKADSCQECKASLVRKLVDGKYTCEESCEISQYIDKDKICTPCSDNKCEICKSNKCNKCLEGNVMEDGICKPACSPGKVAVPNKKGEDDKIFEGIRINQEVCVECEDPNCYKCGTDRKCEICNENSLMQIIGQSKTCVDKCHEGNYEEVIPAEVSFEVKKCTPCGVEGCKICGINNPEKKCKKCSEGLFLDKNNEEQDRCLTPCEEGTVRDENDECIKCTEDDSCKTCYILPIGSEKKTKCDTCSDNTVMQSDSDECKPDCKKSEYKEGGKCHPCGPNCLTCSSEKKCEICKDGFKFDAISKEGETHCVDMCGPGKTYKDVPCPEGKTADECNEMKCVECTDENCLTCSKNNEGNCEECKPEPNEKILLSPDLSEGGNPENEVCVKDCASGFFENSELKKCEKCNKKNPNCKLCDLEDKCTICADPFILNSSDDGQTANCVSECPAGSAAVTEGNIKKCVKCEIPDCKDCSGNPSECKECKATRPNDEDPLYLDISENPHRCVEECGSGSKKSESDNKKVCEDCSDSNCKKCNSDAKKCTQCKANFYLQEKEINGKMVKVCVEECDSGFTKNAKELTCEPCNVKDCIKCNTSVETCNQCDKDLFVMLEEKKECNKCEDFLIKVGEHECKPCDVNDCKKCVNNIVDGESKETCKKCGKGLKLQNREGGAQECVENCDKGFIGVNDKCEKCNPEKCSDCTGPASGECIQCEQADEMKFLFTTIVGEGENAQVVKECKKSCGDTHYPVDGKPIELKGAALTPANICHKCPPTCAKCNDTGKCTECVDGLSLKDDGSGECVDNCGDGHVSEDGKCVDCTIPDCKVCQDGKDTCSECFHKTVVDREDKFVKCTEMCDDGYFFDGPEKKCRPCALNCARCDNADTCMECTTPFVIATESNKCVPKCSEGEFPKNNKRCTKCSTDKCLSCPNDKCDKCEAPAFLKELEGGNTICVNDCGDGFFNKVEGENTEEKRTCEPCTSDLNCKDCSDENTCILCNPPNHLLLEDGKVKCVENCGPGKTDILVEAEKTECQDCDVDECRNCNGDKASCKQCFNKEKPLLSVDDKQCLKECPAGQMPIEEGNVKKCKECDVKKCGVCSLDEANKEKCDECVAPLMLKNGECVEGCSDGYTTSDDKKECNPCKIQECKDCNGNDSGCDECGEEMILATIIEGKTVNPKCLPECPEGMFEVKEEKDGSSIKVCKKCPEECKSCELRDDNKDKVFPADKKYDSKEVKCTECKEGNFKNDNSECVNDCGDGFFKDNQEGTANDTCKPCSTDGCKICPEGKCETCNEGLLYDIDEKENDKVKCVEKCVEGEYAKDGHCVTCEDSNCKKCNENGKCETCKKDFFLDGTICKDDCGISKYGKDGICHSCNDLKCKLCDQEGKCSECKKPKVLQGEACKDTCDSGFYADDKRVCQPCGDENCKTCENNSCTKCKENMVFRIIDDKKVCKPQCKKGEIPITNKDFESPICQKCYEGDMKCDVCKSDKKCETCAEGLFNDEGICVKTCPDGKAADENGKCKKCNIADCKKCPKGVDTCDECVEKEGGSLQFLLSITVGEETSSECVEDCGDGHRVEGKKCQPCQDKNCKKCNAAADNCDECTGLMALFNDACIPDDECTKKTGMFLFAPVAQPKECKECNDSCKECKGSSDKDCTGCDEKNKDGEPLHLEDGKCVTDCSAGSAPKDGECKPCEVLDCAVCLTTDTCSKCGAGLVLQDGECKPQCDDDHYNDEGICKPCGDDCILCEEKKICKACNPEKILSEVLDAAGKVIQASCKDTCKKGEFVDTLTDPVTKKCVSCSTVEVDGKPLVNCKKCDKPEDENAPQVCEKCDKESEMKELFLKDGNCVEKCGDNMFEDIVEGKCDDCIDKCVKCTDKIHCSECDKDHVLLNKQMCKKECPEKMFADGTPKECKSCENEGKCLKCSSTSSCDKCISGEIVVIDETSEDGTRTEISSLPLVTIDSSYGEYSPQMDGKKMCIDRCPEGKFYFKPEDGEPTCKECTHGCKICNNSDTCSECYQNMALLPNGKCDEHCDSGFIEINNECKPCTVKDCDDCSNKQDKCNKCKEGMKLHKNKCYPNCQDIPMEEEAGFFENYEEKCQKCSYKCKKCQKKIFTTPEGEQKTSSCDECVDGAFMNNHNPGQEPKYCNSCNPGKDTVTFEGRVVPVVRVVEGEIKQCKACKPENCKKCVPNKPGKCQVCKDSHILHNGSCIEKCPREHFMKKLQETIDSINDAGETSQVKVDLKKCEQCETPCENCTDKKTCIDCIAEHYLLGDKCVKDCGDGKYEGELEVKVGEETIKKRECLDCGEGCKDCDKDKCLKCNDKDHIIDGKNCIDHCPKKHFKDIVDGNNVCKPCHTSCEECDKDGCTKCKNDDVLVLKPDGNICEKKCPVGTHKHAEEGKQAFCKDCKVTGCDECDAKKCHKCSENLLFEGEKCVIECSGGFFKVDNEGKCENCDPKCKLCSGSADNCSKCKNGFYLKGNKCVVHCGDGHYNDPMEKLCKPCMQEGCKKCHGDSGEKCDNCGAGKVSQEGVCVGKCSEGYFLDEFNNVCKPCEGSCSRCKQREDGSSQCIKCLGDFKLVGDKCVNPCPDSFTKVDGVCRPCFQESCKECALNSRECSKCSPESGKVLHRGFCHAECPEGFFIDVAADGSKVCKACGEGCNSCKKENGDVVCDDCENGFYMQKDATGKDVCNRVCITPGYFPHCDTRKCEPCHATCGTCYSGEQDECIDCAEGFFLNYKQCVPAINCPAGKYGNTESGACEFCEANNCDKCSQGGKKCDVCREGFILRENECHAANAYYGVINLPTLVEAKDGKSNKIVRVKHDLKGLLGLHRALSFSFWIRQVTNVFNADGFHPIVTIDNEGENIVFGVKKHGETTGCELKLGGSSIEVANCSMDDLNKYTFFAVSLKHVGDKVEAAIRRGERNSESKLEVAKVQTVNFSSGSGLLADNAVISFNDQSDKIGVFEITKFKIHDYQLGDSNVPTFYNDRPAACDYYCNDCSKTCNTCANAEKAADTWRCPAGGFDLNGNTEVLENKDIKFSVAKDATHDFTSAWFQLDFWLYIKSENAEYKVKSQASDKLAVDVAINNSSITVNGQNMGAEGLNLEANNWYHFAIQFQRRNLNVVITGIRGEIVSGVQGQADYFRRIFRETELVISKTDVEIKKFYFLINNVTSEFDKPHLPPNCVSADQDLECNKCEVGFKLSAGKECHQEEEPEDFENVSPGVLTVFDNKRIPMILPQEAASENLTYTFWMRKMIASIMTEQTLQYTAVSAVSGKDNITELVDVKHVAPEDSEYKFISDITSGEQKYTWNTAKPVDSYSEWFHYIITVENKVNLTIYISFKGKTVLTNKVVLNDPLSAIIIGSEQKEANIQYAKTHRYNRIITEEDWKTEASPVPCDGAAIDCDWDTGKSITCVNKQTPNPETGRCPPQFVGFLGATQNEDLHAGVFLSEYHLPSFGLSENMASSQYSVIGLVSMSNVAKLPEGKYLVFNVVDTWAGRVTDNTTTKHLIGFQAVKDETGKISYDFVVNNSLEIQKISIGDKIEIKDGDLLLIHAGVNVLTKTFKYYIENKRTDTSYEETVTLTAYPEHLVQQSSLRIFYNDKKADKSLKGYIKNLYLSVNSFYNDAYVNAYKKIKGPQCDDANCTRCGVDHTGKAQCYGCKDGYNIANGICVATSNSKANFIAVGDMATHEGSNTLIFPDAAMELYKINQLSFYVRRNYFDSSAPNVLELGNLLVSLSNVAGDSQIVFKNNENNKTYSVPVSDLYKFFRVRVIVEDSSTTLRVEENGGDVHNQVIVPKADGEFIPSIGVANGALPMTAAHSVYGVEGHKVSTAAPSIPFENLDCKGRFEFCFNGVPIIAPLGVKIETGDGKMTSQQTAIPIFRSNIVSEGNSSSHIRVGDASTVSSHLRSDTFVFKFQLTVGGRSPVSARIFSIYSNKGMNTHLLSVSFISKDNKFVVEKTSESDLAKGIDSVESSVSFNEAATHYFIRGQVHSSGIRVVVSSGMQDKPIDIALDNSNIFITNDAHLRFGHKDNESSSLLILNNFVFDVSGELDTVYGENVVMRQKMVEGCGKQTLHGDICAPKDTNAIYAIAYSDITPHHYSNMLATTQNNSIKIKERLLAEKTNTARLSAWIRIDNLHFSKAVELVSVLFEGKDIPMLSIAYHHNTGYHVNVSGSKVVFANKQIIKTNFNQWMHITTIIKDGSISLRIVGADGTVYNDSEELITKLPGEFNHTGDARVALGPQGDSMDVVAFDIYDLVAIFGAVGDVQVPQAPINVPRSCLSPFVNGVCKNKINSDIAWKQGQSSAEMGMFNTLASAFDNMNGTIYAPSFGITLQVKKSNENAKMSGKNEYIFVIGGGKTAMDLAEAKPEDIEKIEPTLAVFFNKDGQLNVHFRQDNNNSETGSTSSFISSLGHTDMFAQILYDSVQRKLIVTLNVFDVNYSWTVPGVRMLPLTASSLFYKNERIGELTLDLNGIDSAGLDINKSNISPMFCKGKDESSKVKTCEYVARGLPFMPTSCEEGYIPVSGKCMKQNNLDEKEIIY